MKSILFSCLLKCAYYKYPIFQIPHLYLPAGVSWGYIYVGINASLLFMWGYTIEDKLFTSYTCIFVVGCIYYTRIKVLYENNIRENDSRTLCDHIIYWGYYIEDRIMRIEYLHNLL